MPHSRKLPDIVITTMGRISILEADPKGRYAHLAGRKWLFIALPDGKLSARERQLRSGGKSALYRLQQRLCSKGLRVSETLLTSPPSASPAEKKGVERLAP